jgi:hypothetical protein
MVGADTSYLVIPAKAGIQVLPSQQARKIGTGFPPSRE